jgi:hypothetical protein
MPLERAGPIRRFAAIDSEIHPAHATHATAVVVRLFLLRHLAHHALGGDHQAGDGRGVLPVMN